MTQHKTLWLLVCTSDQVGAYPAHLSRHRYICFLPLLQVFYSMILIDKFGRNINILPIFHFRE